MGNKFVKHTGFNMHAAIAVSSIGRAHRVRRDGYNTVATHEGGVCRVYARREYGWRRVGYSSAARAENWVPIERDTGTIETREINRLFESAYPQYAPPPSGYRGHSMSHITAPATPPDTAPDDARKTTQIRNIARGLDLLADVDENFVVDVVVAGDDGRRIVVISEEDEYSARRESFDVIASPAQIDLRIRLADLGWEPSPLGDGYFFTIC